MNKIILIPIIIIALIYFVIFHLVPSVKETSALRDTRDAKIQEVIKTKQKKEKLIKYMSEVDSHEQEVNFISNFVPKDPSEHEITNLFEQKAKDNNVSLFILDFKDKVSQGAEKGSLSTNSSEISVSASGSYDDLKKFLNEIFYSNRLYNLDTFKVERVVSNSSDKKETPSDNLVINISFNYTYIPSELSLSKEDIDNNLKDNYTFINKLIEVTAKVRELEKVTQTGRGNPFLPS